MRDVGRKAETEAFWSILVAACAWANLKSRSVWLRPLLVDTGVRVCLTPVFGDWIQRQEPASHRTKALLPIILGRLACLGTWEMTFFV